MKVVIEGQIKQEDETVNIQIEGEDDSYGTNTAQAYVRARKIITVKEEE